MDISYTTMGKYTLYAVFWLSIGIRTTSGDLVNSPSDQNVTVGQRVTFFCKTNLALPVYWYLNHTHEIFYGGRVSMSYKDEFEVDSTNKGEYNLIIASANESNNGEYTCGDDEGQGEKKSARLHVTASPSTTAAGLGESTESDSDWTVIIVIVIVVVGLLCVGVVISIIVCLRRRRASRKASTMKKAGTCDDSDEEKEKVVLLKNNPQQGVPGETDSGPLPFKDSNCTGVNPGEKSNQERSIAAVNETMKQPAQDSKNVDPLLGSMDVTSYVGGKRQIANDSASSAEVKSSDEDHKMGSNADEIEGAVPYKTSSADSRVDGRDHSVDSITAGSVGGETVAKDPIEIKEPVPPITKGFESTAKQPLKPMPSQRSTGMPSNENSR